MSEDRQALLAKDEDGGDKVNLCGCTPMNGCRRLVLRFVTWGGFDLFILLIIVAVSIAWSPRTNLFSCSMAYRPRPRRMRSESRLVCADVLSLGRADVLSLALMCSHSRAPVLFSRRIVA